jgi:hypothetical protein
VAGQGVEDLPHLDEEIVDADARVRVQGLGQGDDVVPAQVRPGRQFERRAQFLLDLAQACFAVVGRVRCSAPSWRDVKPKLVCAAWAADSDRLVPT